ncbi:hypothetical protein IGI37_003727 [Enterococcus sp. AZ194]|uniref:hypothetical protein n=1 Tax=Enterococcus sp. AZ194 TaxID=2774629 RepID=UPI003F28CB64
MSDVRNNFPDKISNENSITQSDMLLRYARDNLSRKARLLQDALIEDYNNIDSFSSMTYSINDLTSRIGYNGDVFRDNRDTLQALIELDDKSWWWSTLTPVENDEFIQEVTRYRWLDHLSFSMRVKKKHLKLTSEMTNQLANIDLKTTDVDAISSIRDLKVNLKFSQVLEPHLRNLRVGTYSTYYMNDIKKLAKYRTAAELYRYFSSFVKDEQKVIILDELRDVIYTEKASEVNNSELNRDFKASIKLINKYTRLSVDYQILEKRKQKIYSYLVTVKTKSEEELEAIEFDALPLEPELMIEPEPEVAAPVSLEDTFKKIWKLYPIKVKKKRAFSYFEKNLADYPTISAEDILAATQNYLAVYPNTTTIGSTFFGQEIWKEYLNK